MYYKTRDPFRTFDELASQANKFGAKLINDLANGVTIESAGVFTPRLDLIELNDKYLVLAELPGIAKENVSLKLNEEGKLSISGKKEKKQEIDGTIYHRTERIFSDFERTILLPEIADTESVAAKFENGVLEITIAKKEPVKPKETKIEIL